MEKKTESSNSNVTNAPITLSSPLGQPNENFTAGRNAPLSGGDKPPVKKPGDPTEKPGPRA